MKGRIGRETSVGILGEPRVPLQVEAGAAPVGEEIVELEVGRSVLLDVEGDDELGDCLCVRLGRRTDSKRLSHAHLHSV